MRRSQPGRKEERDSVRGENVQRNSVVPEHEVKKGRTRKTRMLGVSVMR